MIHPLTLGSLTLPHNLIFGPLAGYSCAPYRVLAEKYSRPAFCCTEMLSAKHLMSPAYDKPRFLYKSSNEGKLCFQLSGNDPKSLATATSRVTDLGADLVDLNCGCPQPKIRKKGVGSRLLETPSLLFTLVSSMRKATTVPLSIKIRIDEKGDYLQAAKAAQDAGADFIVAHGRHWTHGYDVPCQTDKIATLVEALSIPVIANGDAEDMASLTRLVEKTKCAGVMISRAGLGQPWLIAQLIAEANQLPFTPPSLLEITQCYLEHVQGLIPLDGEKLAVLQARKLAKYYFKDIALEKDFFNGINQLTDYMNLHKHCNEFIAHSD
jgi:tRNA-dihydrouridine synthase B